MKDNHDEIIAGIVDLYDVVSLVRRHGAPGLADRFCTRIELFLHEGGKLAEHLGVKTEPGQSHAGKIYNFYKRDRYICAARACCIDVNDFLEKLADFRKRWPSIKATAQPPADCSNLQKNLWLAFATGAYIPADKTIRSILRTKDILPASSRTGGRHALDLLSDHDRKIKKSNA